MASKINKILSEIEQKKQELQQAYLDLMKKYDFKKLNGKIIFSNSILRQNKKFKKSAWKSIFGMKFRHALSIPFIYSMMIPVLLLDLALLIYQRICFPLYHIPRVRRKDYIVLDRQQLNYLNWLEKINCVYCSYANGIFSYAVEVAGRTEKYRCPIKHAKKQAGSHEWEQFFADYGDAETFRKVFNEVKCFDGRSEE